MSGRLPQPQMSVKRFVLALWKQLADLGFSKQLALPSNFPKLMQENINIDSYNIPRLGAIINRVKSNVSNTNDFTNVIRLHPEQPLMN
ncbi:hypothetical protein DPMN_015104 [Dreissena polymorpha]|uniref:Uncharacterized protein n=1 Tax=Dreissena polymorpha TaxID=45954 RepID=A0A9D4S5A2_DREPO|nr:hypothetical protein DPMN_015104 [Dreissena polymorpha]